MFGNLQLWWNGKCSVWVLGCISSLSRASSIRQPKSTEPYLGGKVEQRSNIWQFNFRYNNITNTRIFSICTNIIPAMTFIRFSLVDLKNFSGIAEYCKFIRISVSDKRDVISPSPELRFYVFFPRARDTMQPSPHCTECECSDPLGTRLTLWWSAMDIKQLSSFSQCKW